MIYLKNDYSMGAHPKVMEALVKTNLENTDGYCIDPYCDQAAQVIKDLFDWQDMDVHFTMAGTQTNLTAIAAFLRPHQAVIAADTGHICVHETGAIEATGHKIIHVPTQDGKLFPEAIDKVMKQHEDEHWVQPKMIYISNLTETGYFYTKHELMELRKVCDKYDLWIYMDGARLPMAVSHPENDLDLEDIPKICDAFYLGGTKCGILFGEALCLVNPALRQDTRFLMKQRGAILAKGRLLGVQFLAILEDNLYFDLGKKANLLADRLAKEIAKKGYGFAQEPCSNLVFPIFPQDLVDELEKKVMFEYWEHYDDGRSSIRLVTSWSTTDQDVDDFLKLI